MHCPFLLTRNSSINKDENNSWIMDGNDHKWQLADLGNDRWLIISRLSGAYISARSISQPILKADLHEHGSADRQDIKATVRLPDFKKNPSKYFTH